MRGSSRGDVDPFIVMDVMEAARALEAAGRHIIHMEVGQPGTPAPAGARAALAAAMERDALGYTVALGLPELRRGIADLYRRWYGLDLNPDRVVVTPGASGAFVLAFSALFDAGERVALGLPGYPSYRQILRAMSLTPVGIPTSAATRYQPTPDMLPADIAGLIVASPNNPTGTMLGQGELAELAAACQARDLAFISDEIYHGLHYDRPAVTALQVTDKVVVVNSFSKYFSMTGWRIGWMVVPESQIRRFERLAQNMFICPPHASQIAALAALDCAAELDANLAVYTANRQLLLDRLPAAGLDRFAPPDGSFFIHVDVSEWTNDSRELAGRLLHEAGVAVTPGLDFDPDRGHRSLRLSYAGTTADIEEGLTRMHRFFARS